LALGHLPAENGGIRVQDLGPASAHSEKFQVPARDEQVRQSLARLAARSVRARKTNTPALATVAGRALRVVIAPRPPATRLQAPQKHGGDSRSCHRHPAEALRRTSP